MLSYGNYSEDRGQSSFIQHLPSPMLGAEHTVKKTDMIPTFMSSHELHLFKNILNL